MTAEAKGTAVYCQAIVDLRDRIGETLNAINTLTARKSSAQSYRDLRSAKDELTRLTRQLITLELAPEIEGEVSHVLLIGMALGTAPHLTYFAEKLLATTIDASRRALAISLKDALEPLFSALNSSAFFIELAAELDRQPLQAQVPIDAAVKANHTVVSSPETPPAGRGKGKPPYRGRDCGR